jgi:hypothetical protein
MTSQPELFLTGLRSSSRVSAFALSLLCALTMIALQSAEAQTYTVLHNFTGELDGATPYAGLTWDGESNFYGTAAQGGYTGAVCYNLLGATAHGCGTVYRLHRSGSTWTFSTIYEFRGGTVDGNFPLAPITIARDGSLYGTTWAGDYNGSPGCEWSGRPPVHVGCGIVFHLRPPAGDCRTSLCSWTETISWAFPGSNQGGGSGPSQGQLVFDQAGNLYGTNWDSKLNPGEIFQLVPAGGNWTIGKTYVTTDASGSNSPFLPLNAVTLDSAGNAYSTSQLGPEDAPNCGGPAPLNGCGTVFQLVPTASGWNANIIYTFADESDGRFPVAGLVADRAGNLYGVSSSGGTGSGGVVFQLSPSGGGWTYHQIYALPNGYPQEVHCFVAVNAPGCSGPWGTLLTDSAGNLYGASYANGADHYGNVFKLTQSNGSWTYTDLYDFTGGNDGANPVGALILDGNGNLFGTTVRGGSSTKCFGGCGVVFEITP